MTETAAGPPAVPTRGVHDMTNDDRPAGPGFAPGHLFLILLAIIFLGEMATMVLVEAMLPRAFSLWGRAAIDAAVLTLVCLPTLWLFFLQPMRQAVENELNRRRVTEASALLERIFDNTHVLIAYLDRDFNFIRVNRAYAAADRREPEFFPGRNHFVLYPGPENEALFRQVVESGEPLTVYGKEFVYPEHPEWGPTWWDWSLHPLKGPDGRVEGLLFTLIDVTARRRAELAREQSERNVAALLNAIRETVLLVDPGGAVLAANRMAASRFGTTIEKMIGANVFNFLPEDLAAGRQARLEEARRTAQPIQFEDVQDGRHLEHTIYPVVDAAGAVVRFAVYSADATERRRTQRAEVLLRDIDHRVLRGETTAELIRFVCGEMVRLFGYDVAWIGRKEADGTVRVLACAGADAGYEAEMARIGVRWDDAPEARGPGGTAIRTGRTQVFSVDAPGFAPWREAARRHGLRAMCGIPLLLQGQVFGVFALYSRFDGAFERPETLAMLGGIAGRVCVALEAAGDQAQLRLLRAALAAAGNGVFVTDVTARIQWVNAAFARLTGYGEAELIGATPRLWKSGRHPPAYYDDMWQTIRAGRVWSGKTIERRKDGALYTVRQTITPVRDERGEVSHFIAIHEDITAQEELEARIEHMAQHDPLTDLPNRTLFFERLRHDMALAARGSGRLALLFVDLDGFKAVNDRLGHQAGDQLLKDVAGRFRSCVRETDTLARLGGDEFTVLLPQVAGPDDAAKVAGKIIACLGEPFSLDGERARVGASVGIALYPADAVEASELLNLADGAMYRAKEGGRNTYLFACACQEEKNGARDAKANRVS
jgi:diguanylate cyclase (GGDEF)-like protein/PAS domain S-box-containing protein